MEHEVPNRYDDITDYEESDQEDGELLNLPNFSTNEFASLVQVDAHRVVLGLYLATWKHFKYGLVGYHDNDDDGLELWMPLMEADLKHGLEHAVSSLSRANPGESFVLILLLFLNFHFLNVQ
ncbi:hypothetical protein Tco_0432849 [Tanacetum coccineum]